MDFPSIQSSNFPSLILHQSLLHLKWLSYPTIPLTVIALNTTWPITTNNKHHHDDDMAINPMPVAEVIRKKGQDCWQCSACNFNTNRHGQRILKSGSGGFRKSCRHSVECCSLYANKLPPNCQLQKACAPPILANCCTPWPMRWCRKDEWDWFNTHHLLRSKNNIKG